MSNLVSQYGSAWFYNKFNGSYFMYEDTPHVILTEGASSRRTARIPCGKLTKNEDGSVTSEEVNVPVDAFTDVSVFRVPNLGWRASHEGKYIAYYYRNNNSYHRGLAARNLVIMESDLTKWMRRNRQLSGDVITDNFKAYCSLVPEFLPITEGIRKMAAGEIISFAASPTIAIVPETEDKFNIMFKTKVAGYATPDGTISLSIPELNTYMENM